MRFSPSYEKLEYDAEVPPNLINHKVNVGTNENAGTDLVSLMGDKVFDFPKPVSLIKYIINFNDDPTGIYLDFFSGSGTLAQAILELNSESDNNSRKFICVQIPEKIEIESGDNPEQKKVKQNAIDLLGSLNKPSLITEIGKERIRRAAKKIKEETNAEIDYGFRVYRLDESNMQDVYYKPQDYVQSSLDLFADNVKPYRTSDDLLAQVMLDWGLPLSLKIETKEICGKNVFKVAENSLFACFDEGIDEDFAKELASENPLRVVFKDNAFKDDTAKTNVKQLLKQLSPTSEMKVI